MEFTVIDTHTAAGWEGWYGVNYQINEDTDSVALAKESTPVFVSPEPLATSGTTEFEAIDVALGVCGNPYVLNSEVSDGTRRYGIYRYDRTGDAPRRLPSVGRSETEFEEPTALYVTEKHIYVGDSGSGRVHILPKRRPWGDLTAASVTAPLAIDGHGRAVYVLDAAPESGSVLRIGEEETTAVIEGLAAPTDMTIDANGNVYILDRRDGKALIRKFDPDRTESTTDNFPLENIRIESTRERFDPSCIEVIAEDEIVAGIGSEATKEKSLFRYVPAKRTFERKVSFKRSCSKLLARRNRVNPSAGSVGELYAIDDEEHRVYALEGTSEYRINRETSRYNAYVVKCFDSGSHGTRWHTVRVGTVLEGPGTQVRLSYHATDDKEELTTDLRAIDGIGSTYTDRLHEANITGIPDLIRLNPREIATIASNGASVSLDVAAGWLEDARRIHSDDILVRKERGVELIESNPQNALLESAVGRYLWVTLELIGSESSSPRVESFRAYFPPKSYLRYLPAIYRENERSDDFLRRYLSIFESIFADIEEEIDHTTQYLDPYGIPSEYLSWLGSWLAIETDETWSEPAKRELLSRAPELFRKRGTKEGLLEVLNIYLKHANTSKTPWKHALERERETIGQLVESGQITEADGNEMYENHQELSKVSSEASLFSLFEHSDLDRVDSKEIREAYTRFISCPQCFLVLVSPFVTDEQMRTIGRIVDTEKPAHATGQAIELRPRMQLGENSFLGANTLLPTRELVLDTSSLGNDSVLAENGEDLHSGPIRRSGVDEAAT